MYASELMSRQTPICAVAGVAVTTKATNEMATSIVQSLAFLIGNQLTVMRPASAVQVITLSKYYVLNGRTLSSSFLS